MTQLSQNDSQCSSGIGPAFFVGQGRKQLAFQRVIDGPEEGSVVIDLVIDGEIHHSVTTDAAGWESVLAHTCRAGHHGGSFQSARWFHEAESHV